MALACLRNTCRMRCPDVLGGEDRGGHLVEERLEDVVVSLVDEEHAGLTLPQGAGRRETAEAPAHDEDSRVACRGRRNGYHCQSLRCCLVTVRSYGERVLVAGNGDPGSPEGIIRSQLEKSD